MNIDSISLQCFLAVAKTGSFTKAAHRVGRTQSAISQQIAKLEHWIDQPLFHRGRELCLTPAGERFLNYAERIYQLHCESVAQFKTPELQGELRFGLPEDFAALILSDILVEFSRLHPRITLSVECDLTLNLVEKFHQDKFDLILAKADPRAPINNSTKIWNEPLDWIGKNQLLAEAGTEAPIPLVLSPSPCVYRTSIIESLENANLKWRQAFSSPSYAGKIAAVQAGLGITAMQRSMIPSNFERLDPSALPKLKPIQVCLLKRQSKNAVIESLEFFIMDKLKPGFL